MFGSLGNMAGMLKQVQEMQKQMKQMQEQLAEMTFEADAGGGAVTATVNGKMDLVKVQIQPESLKAEEREILEDLIVAAAGAASTKARQAAQEEMAKITGGLNLPGLGGMLGGQ